MYLQKTEGILQSHEVKIKYDCAGGFEKCGQEIMLKLKYAEKNYKDNEGKHICRQCQLRAKNPMKRAEIKEKVKKTCLKKYGTALPLNSEENIQKRREQFQNEEFKQKWLEEHKKTALKKYGVEHHMKSDISKKNQKRAMQVKYGVDHPYQSPEIMAKMRARNMQKYGVENVASLPEVQIKMAKTTLERYGVEHYNQLPEMREYLAENCREWLAESYAAGGPNKGIVRPEEWNQKQSETVCQRINDGTWQGGGKNSLKGRYNSKKCLKQNPMFRSSYELKLHYYLDHNDDVLYYDYEPFQIPYYDTKGKKRHYTVDFIVKFKNGKIICIEIKNNYSRDEYLEGGKYIAIKSLCEQNNMELEIWANDRIKDLKLDLKNLLQLDEVICAKQTADQNGRLFSFFPHSNINYMLD